MLFKELAFLYVVKNITRTIHSSQMPISSSSVCISNSKKTCSCVLVMVKFACVLVYACVLCAKARRAHLAECEK